MPSRTGTRELFAAIYNARCPFELTLKIKGHSDQWFGRSGDPASLHRIGQHAMRQGVDHIKERRIITGYKVLDLRTDTPVELGEIVLPTLELIAAKHAHQLRGHRDSDWSTADDFHRVRIEAIDAMNAATSSGRFAAMTFDELLEACERMALDWPKADPVRVPAAIDEAA